MVVILLIYTPMDLMGRVQMPILDLLFLEAERLKTTILFVSHDLSLKRHFKEVCALDEINEV